MSSAEKKDEENVEESKDPLVRGQISPYQSHSEGRKREIIYLIVIIILVILLICAIAVAVHLYPKDGEAQTIESLRKNTGEVVSDHEICSGIGRDILSRSGTAVDAAIATLICNGVLTPHSMGIGGGCFMVIYDKSEQTSEFIDGREIGPHEMNADEFYAHKKPENSFKWNARRVGVPGELKAYKKAHNKYGRLQWKDLFQPTLDFMENGMVLRESTYKALNVLSARLKEVNLSLTNFTTLCEVFCSNRTTGEHLKAGETYYMPKLRETLQGVADHGPDYVYDGPITSKIVKELQAKGSLIKNTDFTMGNEPVSGPSLRVKYGNYSLYTMGRATGGPVLAEILNILEGYNFTKANVATDRKKAEVYHKMIESFKFAYADRQFLEDPGFSKIVDKFIKGMVSKDYAAKIRDKITEQAHTKLSYYTSLAEASQSVEMGTSHVSVLSPYGDAVSVTSTINWYFGCMEMSKSTGIIWNNEMDDFSPASAKANRYGPGRRPRSSMAPGIVVDNYGQVKFVVGASGGSRIATAVAQVTAKMLWMEDDLDKVIHEKRIHHGLFSGNKLGTLELETGFNETNECITKELVKRKHQITTKEYTGMSVVESIYVHEDGRVEGVPDERKLHRAS